MRYNPTAKHFPKGYAGRDETRGKSCFIFYNDDGTVARGPGGELFCFNESKVAVIMARLEAAKKAGEKQPAAAPVAQGVGEDIVFPCADGKISIFRGDVFFFGSNGKNHGVILHGSTDPDKEIVAALRRVLRAMHESGRAATMSGVTLLSIDPMGGLLPRSPAIMPRLLKNRR